MDDWIDLNVNGQVWTFVGNVTESPVHRTFVPCDCASRAPIDHIQYTMKNLPPLNEGANEYVSRANWKK
jgi:hypothetical protein